MKIIIVDDSKQFRDSLKDFLVNKLNHEVIAEASSGEKFFALNEIKLADVILMDIMMKDVDGITATQAALQIYPALKIIAVTMYIEQMYLVQLIETGFKGCVNKTDIWLNLNVALETVNTGSIYFPEDIKIFKKQH